MSITASVCKTFAFRIPDISLIFFLSEIKLSRVVCFSDISRAFCYESGSLTGSLNELIGTNIL